MLDQVTETSVVPRELPPLAALVHRYVELILRNIHSHEHGRALSWFRPLRRGPSLRTMRASFWLGHLYGLGTDWSPCAAPCSLTVFKTKAGSGWRTKRLNFNSEGHT